MAKKSNFEYDTYVTKIDDEEVELVIDDGNGIDIEDAARYCGEWPEEESSDAA